MAWYFSASTVDVCPGPLGFWTMTLVWPLPWKAGEGGTSPI